MKNLAGAPGFEPGNGGIKIRCLTTWLRPKARRTILADAGQINRHAILPNAPGDRYGTPFSNGEVATPPGASLAQTLRAIQNLG